MASTSLPLATAAAVATLFAAPAGAQPATPTTPNTPAPAQPGVTTPETQPTPETPTPSQPGVTPPGPEQVMPPQPTDPKLPTPSQPGVTPPRVAPLPVPGQTGPDQPAVVQDPPPAGEGTPAPGTNTPQPGNEGAVHPQQGQQGQQGQTAPSPESETLVQPRWEAPRLQSAPAAPVVEMQGPHAEIGANVDGGAVLPGFVANTHHFTNEAGYVGTIGYRTPTGTGEAGVSVEYLGPNTLQVTSYTGGEGLPSNNTTMLIDTTQANMAKAAVEHWIRQQPGGAEALEAASHVTIVPSGDIAPQTVNVAGVTTQWGGSVQY